MEPFEEKNPKNDRFLVDVSPGIITEFQNAKVTVKSNTHLNSILDISKQTFLDGILSYVYGITTKKYIETLDDFLLGLAPEEDIIKIKIRGKAHAYEIITPAKGTLHYSIPSPLLPDVYPGENQYPLFNIVTLDIAKGGVKTSIKEPVFPEKLRDLTLNTFNVNSYLKLFYNDRKNAGIKNIVLSHFSRMIVQETIFPYSNNKSLSEKTGSLSFTVKSNALENRIIIEDYNINFNFQKYIKNEN